jgi:hypothetical protein
MRWWPKDLRQTVFSTLPCQLTGLLTRQGIFALPGPMRSSGSAGRDRHTLIFLDIQQFKVTTIPAVTKPATGSCVIWHARISSFPSMRRHLVGRGTGSIRYSCTDANKAGYRLASDLETAIETTRFSARSTALLSIALWQCWASTAKIKGSADLLSGGNSQ